MHRKIVRLTTLLLQMSLIPLGLSAQSSEGWHRIYRDTLQGTNMEAALSYLSTRGMTPHGEIVVAVIDSGVDTLSVELRDAIWRNPGERLDGKDNDHNGYRDDLYGWNFLGTADGSFNMISAGTQEYREFKRLYPKYKDRLTHGDQEVDDPEQAYFEQMVRKAGIRSYLRMAQYQGQKGRYYARVDSLLALSLGDGRESATLDQVVQLTNSDPRLDESLEPLATDMMKSGGKTTWGHFRDKFMSALELTNKRLWSIENEADKRLLMGDDLQDGSDRYYGNPQLQVEGFDHGNFVASLIAAQGTTYPAARGVYPQARLMIIRAIPNGDEYDKDISSAIYYAVDNGARVINMSFGKYLSPDAEMVQRAIEYAASKDVLLIQAAGNDGLNIDSVAYYPTAVTTDGYRFPNLLRVGASDKVGRRCSFSNYGSREVDLFAPGEEILGLMPGDQRELSQGSSLSAPIVAGVAAMMRHYFPTLSAEEIKYILKQSVRPMAEPSLSSSGGMVDAYRAVRLAEEYMAGRQVLWGMAGRYHSLGLDEVVKHQQIFPMWVKDSSRFYYNKRESGEKVYYLVDASTGEKSRLIKDNEEYARQYREIVGERIDPANVQLYGLKFRDRDYDRFYLKRGDTTLSYDRRTGRLAKSEPLEEEPREPYSLGSAHSPDSLYTMMGSGYDLYLRDNRTGEIRRLTEDGEEEASFTARMTPDTLANNARGFWHGPYYLTLLSDDSEVEEMTLTYTLEQPRPESKTFRMPMPADEGVRQYRLYCYDTQRGIGGYLPIEKYPDQEVKLSSYRTDRYIYFTRMSRGATAIDLCRVDLTTREVKELITEQIEPHINISLHNYQFIHDGRQIIWWSERTGRGNYYLYDSEGRLLNRITKGDQLVAGAISYVDEERDRMIFCGYGQEAGSDPYYRYFYSARLDGRRQTLLTPADATHELSLSTDHRYAIDTYSRVDLPYVTETFALDKPSRRYPVEAIDGSLLRARGWTPPTRISLKAADGETDLYGLMYLPTHLDRLPKYPIISNVYPGPQDDQLARSFVLDDNGNQSLADLGFVVITVAPRGSSPLRGRDFYCYGYGNLRDYPLADDRHAIETLAEKHPFIDLDRVGIYGHSGGGFEAATAILTYPDLYDVAVAASGNHDNNVYIGWWGETFHGLSPDGSHGYIPTNIDLAENLQGRLLLMTGEVDKNVPPASTYRLVQALIDAGKRFDMMLFPGKDHGLGGPYYQNIIRYYFVENLLGIRQNHVDIINHK